ncbi:efflux RND transporter periplasmic adaptor subunit [Weeksellaceae bacterium A-14]|uniref:efflux RND transporter periplasmic adaptor subunit n=1 Tax=Daejeonia sp. YH14 TaxID=3439042 RepID=UPI0031E4A047
MKNISIAAVLLMLLVSCSKESAKEEDKEQKSFVISDTMMKHITIADAQNDVVKDEMIFFGKISADRNQYIDIYPLVGGNVVSVNAELGDYVHRGQVLATIRSTEIAGFQKDLSNAQTDVAVAENNLRVAKEMYAGKLSTEKDVIEAKSELQKARDELNRSRSVNQIYNIHTGSIYDVRSPISGYIVQKNINKGMQLRSDKTDNIFDVANTQKVWAIVNVNESDISKIALGMKAEVSTLANPGQVFYGKVDKIFRIINTETNSMQVRVDLDNAAGQLIPESKASIRLLNNTDIKAVSVPKEALIFDDGKYFVVVFRSPSDVKVQEVQVERQMGKTAYITDGLSAGDRVITTSQLLIYKALTN